jgi:hypothetical protein
VTTSRQSTAALSRTTSRNHSVARFRLTYQQDFIARISTTRLHSLSHTSMLITTSRRRKQKQSRFQHRPFGWIWLAPLLSPNGAISFSMLSASSLSTSRRRSTV